MAFQAGYAGAAAPAPSAMSAEATFDPNGAYDNAGFPKAMPSATPASSVTTTAAAGARIKGAAPDDRRAAVAATFVANGLGDEARKASSRDAGGNPGDSPESPPPISDSCANATVIPGNELSYSIAPFDTTGATSDQCATQALPCAPADNKSVWFEFTPVWAGTISINTNGSSYDTVLAIFNTCGGGAPNCTPAMTALACDDDGGAGTASQITSFPVTAGTTYHICAAAFFIDGGMLQFNFMYAPTPPANDDCANATIVTGVYYNPLPIFTAGATTTACDALESTSCIGATNFVNHSVWYRYTPQYDGMATIDTFGSDFDTVLSVFSACRGFDPQLNCLPAPTELACNDDSGDPQNFLQSRVTNVSMQAGVTYVIKVASFGVYPGGMLDFNLTYTAPPPPNDDCGTPMPVVLSGAPVGSFNPPLLLTIGANTIFPEPTETCLGNGVGVSNSVFYTFVPPCDGLMSINTNGSNYDTVLSVWHSHCGYYSPPAYANPPFVACDDDSGMSLNSQLVNVPVSGGLYYIIKVADFDTDQGGGLLDFNLTYSSTQLGDIWVASPPTDNPYLAGVQPFRDVLQNRNTANTLDQGIGASGTPLEGSVGYATVNVAFTQAGCGLSASQVNVSCTDVAANGQGDCPTVTNVMPGGFIGYVITLSGAIPERECTTLTFIGTNAGQKLQYQFLPGDVNMNGASTGQDVLTLVAAINNASAGDPANLARYDINRNGQETGQDVLRLTQLLNGVSTTEAFNGLTAAACP